MSFFWHRSSNLTFLGLKNSKPDILRNMKENREKQIAMETSNNTVRNIKLKKHYIIAEYKQIAHIIATKE